MCNKKCDHEWKNIDDSFDHEFGTAHIYYDECQLCGEQTHPTNTKPINESDYE